MFGFKGGSRLWLKDDSTMKEACICVCLLHCVCFRHWVCVCFKGARGRAGGRLRLTDDPNIKGGDPLHTHGCAANTGPGSLMAEKPPVNK